MLQKGQKQEKLISDIFNLSTDNIKMLPTKGDEWRRTETNGDERRPFLTILIFHIHYKHFLSLNWLMVKQIDFYENHNSFQSIARSKAEQSSFCSMKSNRVFFHFVFSLLRKERSFIFIQRKDKKRLSHNQLKRRSCTVLAIENALSSCCWK